mgnify:CR=1 FL=1
MTAKPLLPIEVSTQASNALAWLHAHAPAGAKLTGDTRRLQPGDQRRNSRGVAGATTTGSAITTPASCMRRIHGRRSGSARIGQ